jgi:hypothetical protein
MPIVVLAGSRSAATRRSMVRGHLAIDPGDRLGPRTAQGCGLLIARCCSRALPEAPLALLVGWQAVREGIGAGLLIALCEPPLAGGRPWHANKAEARKSPKRRSPPFPFLNMADPVAGPVKSGKRAIPNRFKLCFGGPAHPGRPKPSVRHHAGPSHGFRLRNIPWQGEGRRQVRPSAPSRGSRPPSKCRAGAVWDHPAAAA